MPVPACLFTSTRFGGADARATNARVEISHSPSARPTNPIPASPTNLPPKSRDPGQAGTSGAANRARKNQEVRDLREQVATSAQEVAQLRDQIATLTFALGCSERRVAGLVTLSSQLYISYGDSSTGKSVAELALAAKSAEVGRLTDDLAALAQAHEALKAHIATSETSAAQLIAAKDREIADLQAKARVRSDKQLLKKKDEEIAAMETALNSLHSFKSSLLMQLRMRDEDIRALKADLAAARAVSEATAARADSEVTAARATAEAAVARAASEVTAARATAEAAVARAATEVTAAQAASQAAAGQASVELAARTASRRQEVERVQRLSAAYNSYVDALNACFCDTRDNLELYEEACRLYEEGNRLLRHELLAIHVDFSQSESVSAEFLAAAHTTFSEASVSCRQLVWPERRGSTCDSDLEPEDAGLIVPKETSASEEQAQIAAAREALMASEAQLRATAEAIAAEIGTSLTYPGAAVTTASDSQGDASGSTA